jgi:hypothetical protein
MTPNFELFLLASGGKDPWNEREDEAAASCSTDESTRLVKRSAATVDRAIAKTRVAASG